MNKQEIADLKNEMFDWQGKMLEAVRQGDVGQMAAAMNGEANCRFRLLEDRIEKLESVIFTPIGKEE